MRESQTTLTYPVDTPGRAPIEVNAIPQVSVYYLDIYPLIDLRHLNTGELL